MQSSFNTSSQFSKTLPSFFLYVIWQANSQLRRDLIIEAFAVIVGTLMILFQSYQFKIILDCFIREQAKGYISYSDFLAPSAVYVVCLLFNKISIAIRGWSQTHSIPRYYQVILQPSLSYTLRHSPEFFQTHTSGSITRKLFALADNFHNLMMIGFGTLLPLGINFFFYSSSF